MSEAPGASLRRRYGTEPFQYGDLYLAGGPARPRPIVVMHGGFWWPHRSLDMTAPAAADLARRGWTTWNIEYRRNGQGTWPATLDDCDAAIDHLAVLGAEFGFNATSALVVGHSAGGHLAVWSAGRTADAARRGWSPPIVHVAGAVSLAGVVDLARAARDHVGERAVASFVGGGPDETPQRYRDADPIQRLPTGTRVCCLHSRHDERVPFELSVRYVEAARRKGDEAELIEVPGTHRDVIDVCHPAWSFVIAAIESVETLPA